MSWLRRRGRLRSHALAARSECHGSVRCARRAVASSTGHAGQGGRNFATFAVEDVGPGGCLSWSGNWRAAPERHRSRLCHGSGAPPIGSTSTSIMRHARRRPTCSATRPCSRAAFSMSAAAMASRTWVSRLRYKTGAIDRYRSIRRLRTPAGDPAAGASADRATARMPEFPAGERKCVAVSRQSFRCRVVLGFARAHCRRIRAGFGGNSSRYCAPMDC